jgi:hypothetical protein
MFFLDKIIHINVYIYALAFPMTPPIVFLILYIQDFKHLGFQLLFILACTQHNPINNINNNTSNNNYKNDIYIIFETTHNTTQAHKHKSREREKQRTV